MRKRHVSRKRPMQGTEGEMHEVRLLAAAVAHLGEGVLITRAEPGWPGAEIVFVNEALCRITGYPDEELVGRTPRLLQGELTDGATLARLERELAAGNAFRCEVTNYRRDGTPYDVELFVAPVQDEGGRCTHFVSIHRDITAKKQAAEALQESEAVLRSVFASPVANIAMLDADGRIVSVNSAWNQFARENGGPATGAEVGTNYVDVCLAAWESGDETAGEALQALQEVLNGTRQVFSLEYPCHSPTEERWFQMTVTPAETARGGVVVAHFSITERKRAEIELRASRERLELVQAAAHMGCFDWDLRTNSAHCTREYFRLYGLEPSDEKPSFETWKQRLHPEDRDAAADKALRAVETGGTYNDEFRVIWPDGSSHWLAVRGEVACDESGRPVRMLGVNFDVSGRKRAELALRASEEQMRAILDTAADAIITVNRQGIIDNVNPAAETMFGYSRSELVGRNIKILIPSPSREEHDDYLRRYRETGEARIIGVGRELTGEKKDGTRFPIDVSVSEVNPLGLFTGIVRDASERMLLESRLLTIAADEQRRIGQELHDSVGQQVLALGITANTLVQTLKDQATPDQVARAAKLADGLKETLREVRALSKGLVPVDVEAEGLMSALGELAREIGQLHGINCTFQCPRPVRVRDSEKSTHLFRIAQEALANAVKHARPHQITIDLATSGDSIVLTVCDDGVGIPATGARGGGIGLKIMRHRASLVNGRLTVEAMDRGGTLVTCRVPRGVVDSE